MSRSRTRRSSGSRLPRVEPRKRTSVSPGARRSSPDLAERRLVLPDVAGDAEVRIGEEQRAAARLDGGLGDVDRHVLELPLAGQQRLDHQPRLLAVAAPQLQQPDRPAQGGDDLAGVGAQDLGLRPRRVVLRQGGDRLEQARAQLVVEVLGIEELGGRGETAADVLREGRGDARRAHAAEAEPLGGRALGGDRAVRELGTCFEVGLHDGHGCAMVASRRRLGRAFKPLRVTALFHPSGRKSHQ